MARRSRTRTVTRTVVANPYRTPAPVIRVSAPAAPSRRAKIKHYARRAGAGVASEKHTLTAVGAALLYGLAVKSGINIPSIGPLGPAATVGLGAWLYGRTSKNNTAQHLATGLLSVAAYSWGSTGTIAGGVGVGFDD